jgi:2-dehydro-3-deoxyphosphogluconate aldolase/(4S)-4-hydroxy-2-oxoglutarate aldolase
VPLVSALLAGGIDVAEITLRTPCAMDVIGEVARAFGDRVCVGAGTVLEPEQVDLAVSAGSDFIVSPGLSPKVAERCRQLNVLYLPGTSTPTEVMRAVSEFGLKVLKFFPASNCGGVGMLKAFGSVFSDVMFMPTGGITVANVKEYVSLPNVFAAGGSWMVADAAVKKAAESGNWSEVEKGARAARASAMD